MIICTRLLERYPRLFSRVSMEAVNGEVRPSIRKLEFCMSMPMKCRGLWKCAKIKSSNLKRNHGYKRASDYTNNTVPLVTVLIEKELAIIQHLLTFSQNIRKMNS